MMGRKWCMHSSFFIQIYDLNWHRAAPSQYLYVLTFLSTTTDPDIPMPSPHTFGPLAMWYV